MILHKLTTKSLVTEDDIAHNQKIGMPVEVFCTKKHTTIAFGRVERFNEDKVWINGRNYCRVKHVLFGQPFKTA